MARKAERKKKLNRVLTKVRFLVRIGFWKKVKSQVSLSRRKTLRSNPDLGFGKNSILGSMKDIEE